MSRHHSRAARTACIIDGDNIAGGGHVAVSEVAHVLELMRAVNTGWSVTFAMQRRLAVRYMTAYAGLGWAIRFASMAPDAADRVLLDAAVDYLNHGVRDLVVVSGDHAFADLAQDARLHVCAYRSSLSKRMLLAATTITYLDDLVSPSLPEQRVKYINSAARRHSADSLTPA